MGLRSLEGIEGLPSLEEIQIRKTPVADITLLLQHPPESVYLSEGLIPAAQIEALKALPNTTVRVGR